MDLVCEVYRATIRVPDEEMFGLTAQMRSAAIRVTSKVAEGANGEAHAALLELETHVVVAARLEYLLREAARRLYRLVRAAAKANEAITPCRTSSGTA